ncbi:ComEA family DNA-binding protein [Microbulbifer taiwanensis]|uniref:ComEA family DNA-binding protein n=1 Tax=Microbulbifer taiwanensis TaxID=986746 RepID=A0ABW1YHZ5_9GAMM|nr:helix-hairpin-helix domain-containing protein [Microbulbifer taiwanensis]
MNLFRTPLSILFAALLLVCSPTLAIADEAKADTAQMASATVNLNSASSEELAEKLDGIGVARAEMIVKFRDEHGPFTSVEQLLEIKGIGTATLEKNRDRIQL